MGIESESFKTLRAKVWFIVGDRRRSTHVAGRARLPLEKGNIPSQSLPERLRLLQPHLDIDDYIPVFATESWVKRRVIYWALCSMFLVPLWGCVAGLFVFGPDEGLLAEA
jgi:hypothetical protein